jgi:hypothetical protein
MLTKFLGSGAFGEVFEGSAKNIITDSSGETKVAVKVCTLITTLLWVFWVCFFFH